MKQMKFKDARFDPGSIAASGDGAYVYHDPRIILAVNVALATSRPLFVTGAPGAGKSTLAPDIAAKLNWACVSTAITSRTQIDDLVAKFDNVARLNDAQTDNLKSTRDYLVPGVLWWAFDPTSAAELPAGDDP
jgi:MoxR-like ATPase